MSQVSRSLGGAELYAARCHDHYNQNVMLALTIHTRAPLDIGNLFKYLWACQCVRNVTLFIAKIEQK